MLFSSFFDPSSRPQNQNGRVLNKEIAVYRHTPVLGMGALGAGWVCVCGSVVLAGCAAALHSRARGGGGGGWNEPCPKETDGCAGG